MEVSAILRKAWEAVEDAGLPEEIHEAAFRAAVRLYAPTSTAQATQAGAAGAGQSGVVPAAAAGSSAISDDGATVSEDEMYERVVAQTGVNPELLERIVHLDDDGPRVSIAGLRLGRSNSERARAVAQIITITRGFGLEENETSLQVIRDECERLKVYDSANFSSHMKALDGYVINGTGQNRRVRPKGPGIAGFAGLVEKILGEA